MSKMKGYRMHNRIIAIAASAALALAGAATVASSASAQTLCASAPSSCGFPDSTDTGYVGKISSLKVETGPVTLGTKGEVLKNVTTAFPITVTAPDVTIDNVRMVGALTGEPGISLEPAANNTTIEHTLIRGTNATSGTMLVAIKDVEGTPVTGTVVDADNISFVSSGVQIYDGTIENSYIHDLGNTGTEHLEDYNSTGNDGFPVLIQHNTLLNPSAQTAAIYEGADFSPSQNITATDNLLAGGGYTVYGGGVGVGAHADPSGIVFTNNIFSSIYFSTYGRFGPDAYYSTTAPGDMWSGNKADNGTAAGGATINP